MVVACGFRFPRRKAVPFSLAGRAGADQLFFDQECHSRAAAQEHLTQEVHRRVRQRDPTNHTGEIPLDSSVMSERICQ
jgi:hypothetical protein